MLAWAVTVAAFGLFRLGVPSELANVQINAQLGQGQPAAWQYYHYLLRLLHGNLGDTLTVGVSVDTALWWALSPTLSLLIGGMLLWLIAGFAAGYQVLALASAHCWGRRPSSIRRSRSTGSARNC